MALDDGVGQRCFGWLKGNVFFAGEKTDEGAAFQRAVIANGAAEDGVAGFEGVKRGAKGHGRGDLELQFTVSEAREVSQVIWESYADHSKLPRADRLSALQWT